MRTREKFRGSNLLHGRAPKIVEVEKDNLLAEGELGEICEDGRVQDAQVRELGPAISHTYIVIALLWLRNVCGTFLVCLCNLQYDVHSL